MVMVDMVSHAADEIWGLATRFKACQLARNDWVLLIDDDITMTEPFLNTWLAEKQAQPDRLYSLFGRMYADGLPEYNSW